MKRSWQDYAFLTGQIIASSTAIPILFYKDAVIPIAISLMLVVSMIIFAVAQLSLKLKLAGYLTILVGIMWLFIAIFRH